MGDGGVPQMNEDLGNVLSAEVEENARQEVDDTSDDQKHFARLELETTELDTPLPTLQDDEQTFDRQNNRTTAEPCGHDEEPDEQQENAGAQHQVAREDSADERLGEFCNGTDRQQMFPKNRRMKFQYNKTSVISNEQNAHSMKIKRRVYVTSCQVSESSSKKLSAASLEANLQPIAKGRIELRETNCGLLATFYEEDDFTKTMRMSLSKVFDTPVAVWNIPHIGSRANNVIIIRDIPWCVKAEEIEDVLGAYGVHPLHSTRNEDGSVRVVVKNPHSLTKLLREGLNFYNCIILPVSLEPAPNPDIIQCYRCQRFWHTAQYCPFYERCVRCGDKHDFRMCTRDRNNPNCCLCGDSHHAAYKYCPVRIQHLNAIQVEVNMERE